LTTYNSSHTVHFATRIQKDSSTAINNIFVDITRLSSSSTYPITNDISEHDAQFLTVNNTAPVANTVPLKQRTREINNERLMQIQLQLTNESWESVYIDSRASNDIVIKAFYIKNCKILNKVIQQVKYSINRLTAKLDNKIITWNIIKQETGKIRVTEQMPSLLRNDKK
jgi:hypothetical protein